MSLTPSANTPDALLFIGPNCPFCPQVMQALSELVKDGSLGKLEIVNVALHPERAAELGIRTVPWTRLGPFKLEGNQSLAELRRWAELASSEEGMTRYIEDLLGRGELAQVEELVGKNGEQLNTLLPLIESVETPMQVRLGIGAIFEGLQGQGALKAIVEELGRLSNHEEPRVRSDACYFLGLSSSQAARPYLQQHTEDESEEVKEIAQEALESLHESST